MPLSESQIIALVHAQTDPSGNPDDSDASLKLWIADAASAIQRRRGVSEKHVDITLVEGQTPYDLPADCVTVTDVLFERGANDQLLGVPNQSPDMFSVGWLPNGQSVDASTDLIGRQRRDLMVRKEAWRTRGGKLQIECPFTGGEIVRVEYDAEDRTIANVPDRYAQRVVDYVRMMMLRAKADKLATVPIMSGDGLESRPVMTMRTLVKDLSQAWEDFLSALSSESA